ncbi:MAG: carbamoyltransferase [Bryobacteraceae bacterium]
MPTILGISAFYHDSAAALLRGAEIVAAAQEERFTRRKHDASFPRHAIEYCLAEGGVGPGELDYVVFYDKPFLKFERLIETYLAFAPRGFASFRMALPLWIREKLFQKDVLRRELRALAPGFDAAKRLLFTEHHLSHAAAAFFPSPFEEALILTMDGVGEWATTSAALGRGNQIEVIREIHFPHSLGLLYSAFTYYCGFRVNSGEYKLMGLAPYGTPRYAGAIREHLIDVKPDGSFRLNMEYFNYCAGLTMTNARFDTLFGGPPRGNGEALAQRHKDVAASIQAVLEDVVLTMARALRKDTGARNLCLAGGVALNCVANGRLLREGGFESIWIQPAAGDAGCAVGAALAACHGYLGQPRQAGADSMKGSYLGPGFSQQEIESRLRAAGAHYRVLIESELLAATAEALAGGKAVGWFQGRMEFGPRSLGARSILADPRSPTMQSTLNLKVKRRESFRPFAPVVTAEAAAAWFELHVESPYMLLVADVLRSEIPAVTHVDNSARVQTVRQDQNPRFHALLRAFEERTGCPVLVNTSFNVRGEPIVCTPEDAFRCFMGTEIEVLVIGDCYLRKEDQHASTRGDRAGFEPD